MTEKIKGSADEVISKPPKTGAEIASEEYDIIASKYQEATKRELRNFTLEPSLIKYFGNLTGKNILDLACGEGYSSRLSESLGAEEIVGIDVSQKEIEMARTIEDSLTEKAEKEGKKKKTIKYLVGDVAGDLSHLGRYDVITAVMLLHYCSNREMIDKIVKNVKNHLAEDGVFITSTPNPDIVTDYDNYGVRMQSKTKKEGDPFTTTLSDFQGNKLCSFTNYYWTKETYQKIFEENGFEIEWLDSFVSDEGLKKYGNNFWNEFKEKPIYSIIRARLKNDYLAI